MPLYDIAQRIWEKSDKLSGNTHSQFGSTMNPFSSVNNLPRAVITALLFLTGCGGGGGGGNASNAGPPDVTEPTVTAMSPGEDSVGIGINSKLTATLSEPMVAAVINSENFRLTNDADSISGTVQYDTINKIAVFTPSGPLTPNTRYTATIITGIKDLSDNPLSNDFAWCFETGATVDDTAPSVMATVPVGAATGVAVNQKFSITFSEEIDTSTLTSASFSVVGSDASSISGSVTYRGRTAVFKPSRVWTTNTTYTVTTANVMDLAGNALQPEVSWSFTTGANADNLAPVIISTSPANGVTSVPISSSISITFSEPMDPTTITTETFTVTGAANTRVIGTVSFNSTTNTATFTRINHQRTYVASHPEPVSNLEPNTVYAVKFKSGAKDMAGNALTSNTAWSFTTAP